MNLFSNILLDIILIIFPILVFLLYDAYTRIYDLKRTNLYLDFAIITSFYLVLKFKPSSYTFSYLMINVPLIISYLKNKSISVLILSILYSFILSNEYNINIFLILCEYALYFIFFIISNTKFKFLNIFIILKILFYITYESIIHDIDNDYIVYMLLIILSFIIVTYIIYFILKKANEMIKFQNNRKKLEEEKQLRISLFKITHEIKNPITVCKGYLDMFDFNDSNKSKKYVDIMKDEIGRVLILLEDFLSINKIKIEKDIIDLNLLLEEVTNNFIPILKEKNIKRKFDISKDELFINADYNRLNQVLINIIKNSIESIENNGFIKLYLKKNKTNIKIYIEDNGIGMDEEELEKINEPFFTTKKNGTGLGVFLSRQIIESHGGSIKYISKKYSGTKTIVTLPYKEIKI